MESSMELCLENIEIKNEQLHVSLEDTQTACRRLQEEIILLKTALANQKSFHRKYVDEVTSTEELRIEEFNKEKNGLIEDQQSLIKLNRQLSKEVEFYKHQNDNSDSLHEKNISLEKAIEKDKKFHRKYVEDVEANEAIRQRDFNKEKRDYANEIKELKKANRQLKIDLAFYKKAYETLQKASVVEPKGDQRTTKAKSASYRLPSRVANEKNLYEEIKKLQSKISEMSSTVVNLKKKNRQLEDFKNKIEKKKAKFEKDSEVLNWLIDSSKTTNKDKYTPDVLTMLLNLAENKK